MNNLFTFNILDVALIMMYLLGGLMLSQRFLKYSDYRVKIIPYFMVILHLLTTVGFYFFVLNSIGDAKGYYLAATNHSGIDNIVPISNGFVEILLYPFIHFFEFSFFSCSLLFSFLSLRGFLFIYEFVIKLRNGSGSNWLYLFLLPSMHFWTSAIGKDALILFGISWLMFNFISKRSILMYIIPLLIITLTRFYVLALIGVGVGIALVLLSKQLKISYKIFAMLFFLLVGTLILPYFLSTIAISDVESIGKQSELVIKANQEGGGAVDLQGSNIVVKWFSYLFRPFLFEARSAQMLMTALENIVWMVIFWKIILGARSIKFIPVKRQTFFWISLACIVTVTLPSAFILSNFGISSRQKIMIVPMMLHLFFESLLAIQKKKIFLLKNK